MEIKKEIKRDFDSERKLLLEKIEGVGKTYKHFSSKSLPHLEKKIFGKTSEKNINKDLKNIDKKEFQEQSHDKVNHSKYDKQLETDVKKCAEHIKSLKLEVSKVVIGQDKVINGLIRGLICNGHVLLEGVPGIAKTLTIRAIGQAIGCDVKRVQFTVDLLPTDITGITTYTPNKGFEVIKGPVFTNFLIADEINRSPPKTQSALIEAMQ